MATANEPSADEQAQDERRNAREEREHQQETSWLARIAKYLVPVLTVWVAGAQAYLVWSDQNAKKESDRLTREEASKTREDSRRRDISAWIQSVALQRNQLESQDPSVRCRAVLGLKNALVYSQGENGNAVFERTQGVLNTDVALCEKSNTAEYNRAVLQYKELKWEPYRNGANAPYIRWDPKADKLYSETCSVPAKGQQGEASGVCALSAGNKGRIYRVEFSCTDQRRCGWSYFDSRKVGYGVNGALENNTYKWKRYWDGDEHDEAYILYYEVEEQGEAPPPKSKTCI